MVFSREKPLFADFFNFGKKQLLKSYVGTPSRHVVEARLPLLATGLTLAQACGTSFCTHGMVFQS